MSGSEFGRGYATCLRQFANHRARLDYYAAMGAKYGLNDMVESWANGASDHLYDLVRPRRGVSRADWLRAKALQARALDIGHGFRASSKSTVEECTALLDEAEALLASSGHPVATLVDAMALDGMFGLKPQAGSWSCAEDIRK